MKCTSLARSLNRVGIKKKHIVVSSLTQEENRLIEQLRQHPEIRERVRSILEIAGNGEEPLQTADEVEALLIGKMRRLGNVTMRQWAGQAEERLSTELKRQNSTVVRRKTQTLKWWCVFGQVEVRERIWRSSTQQPAPAA
jgi:hypothetical protein